MTTTATKTLSASDLQVGDEIVVHNPYGGRKHKGSTVRYSINRAHYDTRELTDQRFIKIVAEEGTSSVGNVYFHFIALRVNQKTGCTFGRQGWRCINRDRIVAIYRNGETVYVRDEAAALAASLRAQKEES